MEDSKDIILIGYSGHSFVIYDIFKSMGRRVIGYCENEFKVYNPYNLSFYERELSMRGVGILRENDYFIAIGDNKIRTQIHARLIEEGLHAPVNAIHASSVIGSHVKLGNGIMIGVNAVVNAQAKIGDNVVINTLSVVEHEVIIGKNSFIAPNSTILGGAKIGSGCFIGANSVILQNIEIGENCVIGAGTVVIRNIPPNSKVVGNPQRIIKK